MYLIIIYEILIQMPCTFFCLPFMLLNKPNYMHAQRAQPSRAFFSINIFLPAFLVCRTMCSLIVRFHTSRVHTEDGIGEKSFKFNQRQID
jgi:hypothetical protein